MRFFRPLAPVLLLAIVTVPPLTMISCHATPPPSTEPKPSLVSARTLVRDYLELHAPPWDNTRIRVTLPAKDYEVKPERIEWYRGTPGAPPCIVFECSVTLLDNLRMIEITGYCRGRVHDGQLRGGGIDWYVRVEGCSVVQR